jgi:mono/diheme cytochrome c family protein
MRVLARLLALALIAVIAVGAYGVWRVATALPPVDLPAALSGRKADAAHGKAVAMLGDCAGCHTAPQGDDYAGGVAFALPVGTLYSSNITPDPDRGIGRYQFDDFVRLMRFGVTPDGRRVYPAMPYTAYAKVSDGDLQDLFAYLRDQVAPVSRPTRPAEISWPLTLRWPLALWNLAYHKADRFVPDRGQSEEWNRGAYLVEGLAHCGTCHTPRNFAFAERALDGSSPLYLSGASFAGTSPINLRGNDGDGLGRWSKADIAQVLKSGRNPHSAASGPMNEVITLSTQYWDDADLLAVAAYLKSLSPAPGDDRAPFKPDETALDSFKNGQAASSPGARLFMDSCSACHRLNGEGAMTAFPSLAGNPMVQSRDPASLIEVILAGSRLPSTEAAPSPLAMPGFAWRYDDADIATLASFLRSAWGNHAPAVTPGQVTDVRNRLAH